MKIYKTALVMVAVLLLSSCENVSKKNIIEYGEEFDQAKYLGLKEGESSDITLSVDTKTIGTYVLKGVISENSGSTREIEKEVIIEDTEKPLILTIQPTESVYEIPYGDSYQVMGNIDQISDKVDGEYREVQVVDESTYKVISNQMKEAKLRASDRKFTTNEELDTYRNEKLKAGYSILTSDVDTSKAGTYTVKIACFDLSYNITEISYKVTVLEKDSKPADEKLAAGATGGKTGKGVEYQLIDKTKTEVANEQPKDQNTESPIEPTVGSEQTQEIKKFQENVVSNDTVSAQGSPVLQAALDLVGNHLMCDSTVTMALVNGGMITGNPEPIFKDGSVYNIGVYQFPSIATFISPAQAVPGDLIYYDNGGLGSPHIAVYAGNGKAVHGGWNGSDIVISTVNIGSGPRYMRFNKMSWADVSYKIFGSYPNSEEDSGWSGGSMDGGVTNNTTPPDTPSIPDIPTNGSCEYNYMLTVGEVQVAITSSTEIDIEFAEAQITDYADGKITYDQMVSNLAKKGYTIRDPFDMEW